MAAHFERVEEAGVPTLRVLGAMGGEDIRGFQESLAEFTAAIPANASGILDMDDCPYLPSMGIPPLLQNDRELRARGSRLWITAGSALMPILRVLRLDRVLELESGLDAGVEAALHWNARADS